MVSKYCPIIGEHIVIISLACKQALRISGYSKICFGIARRRAREESLQWSLYDLSSAFFSAWLIFHLASLLDSTKIATVAHSNRKTRTTQAEILVKKSENYCLKGQPWMGTSFPNFLTWFRRKIWSRWARNENKRKNRADCIIIIILCELFSTETELKLASG